MDDLDRLYRRLVHNIRASRPEFLRIPFTVRELYEQLVPYRHNRRELAIESNQDYEIAVARLLAGERGYVRGDPAMQEALRHALADHSGDPGAFKEYGDAQITLAPVAEGTQTPVPPLAGPVAGAGPASADVTAVYDAMGPGTSIPSATPVPSLLASLGRTEVATGCRFCGGTLPEGSGREVNYCPHCGENLRTRRCPACGAEMNSDWRFCAGCGRRSD